MRTLIDCDATFDALTRGPFPGGHDFDDAVAAHLASCHDCRELAEALRPAVDLFHESLAEAERTDLPQYVGSVENESLERRILTVIESESLKSPRGSRFDSQRWCAYALAPLVVLVLTALVLRGLAGISDSHKAVALGADPVNGMNLLAALSIPVSCGVEGQGETALATEARFACCTQCHALANPGRPSIRCVAQLTIACSACHLATHAATNCCHDCHDVDGLGVNRRVSAVGAMNKAAEQLTAACGACHDQARPS